MTIIAYRDGIMAADSAVFDGATHVGVTRKIHRLPDGSLFAGAGDLASAMQAVKWFSGPMEDEPPTLRGPLHALLVRPTGKVFGVSLSLFMAEADAPFYADGSGFEIALGAMAAGATAPEAAEIACRFNDKCRGPIQVERIG